MADRKYRVATVLCTLGVVGLTIAPGLAFAQGKIVCWKDKAGKVIGCGDKVPPEFQSSATKELDSRGVTRRTTESVEETNRRRQREDEAARVRAEDERKTLDQKRQDAALLATYSNDKEIDQKRDRDLQMIDLQMEQLGTALKVANQRYDETRTRVAVVEKGGKVPSPQLKDELTRASTDKQRIEQTIDAKRKEKEEQRQRFADYKKRFNELRGNPQPAAPAQAPVASKK